MSVRRRLAWWWFLARYKVARWRGKAWATGLLRPEFIFAYRSLPPFDPSKVALPDGESFGYRDHGKPTPRVWNDPHA